MVALAGAASVGAVVFFFWPTGDPTPPTPAIDPRHEHRDVDAGTVAKDDVFAAALTGHRGRIYFGDVDDIQARGVLRVLTRNNASGYFVYRGVERGFDYEVGDRLAQLLGVRLEMVVAPTRRDLIPWLLEGRGDVVIAGLSTETPRADRVTFSRPYLANRWVVVVPSAPKTGPFPKIESPEDLGKVSLLLRPSSSARARLRALDVPGGLSLIAATESLESEDLLDDIKDLPNTAAVVEESIARLELLHRRDLRIALVLEGNDDAGIATRNEDVALAAVVDRFIADNRGGSDWSTLLARYHQSRSGTSVAVNDKARADKDGRLTPFDETFRAAAAHVSVKSPAASSDGGANDDDAVPLDWRLLAAIAVQESGLNPNAQSPFGARGLMQLLPSTAVENGCDDAFDVSCSAFAAARYLARLARQESRPWAPDVDVDADVDAGDAGSRKADLRDGGVASVALKDRVRFALASYNAGAGHVDDARTLAAAQGKDPDRWFGHVEEAMLLLEKPRHFSTTRHGFARGSETVAYVSEIQSRFDVYVALTAP